MTDLDPRLVELLRRSPAPTALDEAHRAAVAAAARQTWFRAQAARRRGLVATLVAACLVAGLCGFALRGAFETPSAPVAVPLATADEPRSEPPATFPGRDDARTLVEDREAAPRRARQASRHEEAAQPAPAAFAVAESTPPPAAKPAAPPAITATQAPGEPKTRRAGEARREGNKAADAKDKAGAAMVVEQEVDEARAMEAGQGGVVAATASAPATKHSPGTPDIPTDAPDRGRLLDAAVVLAAAQAGRLAGADRAAALRAALASLDGLTHPAAERLRGDLRSALALPR